jgi:hypothetical protein
MGRLLHCGSRSSNATDFPREIANHARERANKFAPPLDFSRAAFVSRTLTVMISSAATAPLSQHERVNGGTTMRRPGRLALFTAALAAFALSACATMNVSSHIERGVDFAQFRTWNFGPADALPTGDPRLDNNPFFKDYLEGAVGTALEARHFVRHTSGTPDLLVHYHANISKTFDVNGIDNRYGYCYDNCEPRVIEYEQGTIRLAGLGAGQHRRRH